MGMYDTVLVPCPQCGDEYPAQSKSGGCWMETYKFKVAPDDVLVNVNRHAPFKCGKCHTLFQVRIVMKATVERMPSELEKAIRRVRDDTGLEP